MTKSKRTAALPAANTTTVDESTVAAILDQMVVDGELGRTACGEYYYPLHREDEWVASGELIRTADGKILANTAEPHNGTLH